MSLQTARAHDWIMVISLGVTWGATFMFIELALRGVGPFWLASFRIAFAAILTLGVWAVMGRKLFLTDETNWPLLGLVGVTSTALPFQLISWGQQYVTSSFVGVCMAAVAMMVLPLAHFLIPSDRLTLQKLGSFCVGFTGILVLFGPQSIIQSTDLMTIFGQLACLGAAFCYALSSVAIRLLPPIDPVGLAAVPLAFGTVFVLPITFWIEGPLPSISLETFGYLALLGLVPTAGANLLRMMVIRSAGPVFLGLVNFQVPVWAVIFGVLFLEEPLGLSLIIALIFILGGLALTANPLARLRGAR